MNSRLFRVIASALLVSSSAMAGTKNSQMFSVHVRDKSPARVIVPRTFTVPYESVEESRALPVQQINLSTNGHSGIIYKIAADSAFAHQNNFAETIDAQVRFNVTSCSFQPNEHETTIASLSESQAQINGMMLNPSSSKVAMKVLLTPKSDQALQPGDYLLNVTITVASEL